MCQYWQREFVCWPTKTNALWDTYHMILISCDGHELRFSKDEGAQVILVHFMEICSGAPFLWFVENYVESRLVLVHRVEDNLPGKQEPIINNNITVKTFRGLIKSRIKDMLHVPSEGKHLNWCQTRENMSLALSAGKHVTGVKCRKQG